VTRGFFTPFHTTISHHQTRDRLSLFGTNYSNHSTPTGMQRWCFISLRKEKLDNFWRKALAIETTPDSLQVINRME
jgi:hypothetical protein